MKLHKRYVVAFLLLITSLPAAAQGPPPLPGTEESDQVEGEGKHPIDVAMEAAQERDASTAGLVGAIDDAMEKWDALLNSSYGRLMKRMDKTTAGRLRHSQRAWMEWRDGEIEMRRSVYSNFRGTMYRSMAAYAEMNLTRERALYLESLAGFIEEEH